MTPDEAERRFAYRVGAFWFGRNGFRGENPLGLADDRHAMLVAGSRGGKGVSVIVPNLALWPGSLVVVDPKGENATLIAARRGRGSAYCDGLGQDVHVLDPMNVTQVDAAYRARFNPLDALDPQSYSVIDDATRIADALVEIGQGESRQWDEGARSLVKTLILHVLTHPHYEGRRNLLTVRRLILRGENEAADAMRAQGNANPPSGHVLLWELARRNEALGGVIAASADSFFESARSSPKQYNSYRIIAETSTEFIDSPGMAECLSASTFSLRDLKANAKGASLFLSLPSRFMGTHYRWLRMMIALAINEMEMIPGRPATGHPVLFALDEFAGLKRMPIIETGVAHLSGFGVKLFFVLQSLEQLKATYGDLWETFYANCGVKIFFATTDNFTNEYVSKALGEQEIIRETENTSESVTEQTSSSTTSGGSKSRQRSTAETRGSSDSWTTGGGTSRGTGSNQSTSRGQSTSESENKSYGPEWFFPERKGRQDGTAESANTGRSWGTSENFTANRNWSSASSSNRGRTTTDGTTDTTSWGETTGSSSSSGQTRGKGQQIFKKPLVTPDELAKLFTRIDDPRHRAYPGLALVSVAGEAPLLVRRTPYHLDPIFQRLIDPHPDHPQSSTKAHPARLATPLKLSMPEYGGTTPRDDLAKKRLRSYNLRRLLNTRFTLSVSRTIPYDIEAVRSVIANTSLLSKWFPRAQNSIDLPSPFYDGDSIGSGFIVSGSPSRPYRFFIESRWDPAPGVWTTERFDLAVKLEKARPDVAKTTVQLTRTFSLNRLLYLLMYVFMKNFRRNPSAEIYLEREATEQLSASLRRLEYACFDLVELGRVTADVEGSAIWLLHEYANGYVYYFDDLKVGSRVGEKDVLGRVRDIASIASSDAPDQPNFDRILSPWGPGTVMAIYKRHGDLYQEGDRILRIEYDPQA
jgi:hypothetical protein